MIELHQKIERYAKNAHNRSLEGIYETVCQYYKVDPDFAFKRTRQARNVYIRYVFYYLAKRFGKVYSLSMIGNFRNSGFDHATVLHGSKKIKGLLEVYPETRKEINEISEKL